MSRMLKTISMLFLRMHAVGSGIVHGYRYVLCLHTRCMCCVCVCVCVLVSKQHASVCVSVHLPKGVGFVAKSRCLVRGHWVARLCVIGSLE